jgi:hypothetical protein
MFSSSCISSGDEIAGVIEPVDEDDFGEVPCELRRYGMVKQEATNRSDNRTATTSQVLSLRGFLSSKGFSIFSSQGDAKRRR